MVHHQRSRRIKNQPPLPPIVFALGPGMYEVLSRRSGEIYIAEVQPDGSIMCGCPARLRCYHLDTIERAHDLANLKPGDGVLVSEAGGKFWHGVFHVDDERVYTFEEPSGFRHVFVVRCERRERKAVAA